MKYGRRWMSENQKLGALLLLTCPEPIASLRSKERSAHLTTETSGIARLWHREAPDLVAYPIDLYFPFATRRRRASHSTGLPSRSLFDLINHLARQLTTAYHRSWITSSHRQ